MDSYAWQKSAAAGGEEAVGEGKATGDSLLVCKKKL